MVNGFIFAVAARGIRDPACTIATLGSAASALTIAPPMPPLAPITHAVTGFSKLSNGVKPVTQCPNTASRASYRADNWGESATAILQLPVGRPDRGHPQMHMRLFGRAPAFFQIACQTGSRHIFPAGNSAQTARYHMVEGKIVARAAILAFKFVAKKKVEPGEGGIFAGFHILPQRNYRWNFHVQIGAVHFAIIIGDDIDLVEEHRLDGCLPWP